VLTEGYSFLRVEENEMGRSCGTFGREMHAGFCGESGRKRTLGTTRPRRGDVILMSLNSDGKLNGFI
jgi:hypothetical protein